MRKLLPDVMCIAVKESAAHRGGGGGGGSGGGGSGGAVQSVSLFDADHETPELIWNTDTRRELRECVSQLIWRYAVYGTGTGDGDGDDSSLSRIGQGVGVSGLYLGSPWDGSSNMMTCPVMVYTTIAMEVVIGGVYVMCGYSF